MSWKLRDKPDWLDLKRYGFPRRLDAICWYHALKFRYDQAALWKELRALDKDSSYIWVADDGEKADGGITRREFFELYLAQAQDPPGFDLAATEQVCELAPKISKDEQGLTPGRTLQLHYAVDLDAPDDALIASFKASETGTQARAEANRAPVYPLRSTRDLPYDFVASDSMRIFIINAKGERQRHGQFENQLDLARKTYGSALRRRGPRAFGDTYSPDHGRRWCQYQVLPILDLDLFYLVNKEPKATHAELGNWLRGTQVRADPKEWGREARRAVDHALSCLLSLRHA